MKVLKGCECTGYKAMHKIHEIITQTPKDDSSCFNDVSSKFFQTAVAFDVKQQTASSISSHSVSIVTQAHNALDVPRRSRLHEMEACGRQRSRGRV